MKPIINDKSFTRQLFYGRVSHLLWSTVNHFYLKRFSFIYFTMYILCLHTIKRTPIPFATANDFSGSACKMCRFAGGGQWFYMMKVIFYCYNYFIVFFNLCQYFSKFFIYVLILFTLFIFFNQTECFYQWISFSLEINRFVLWKFFLN